MTRLILALDFGGTKLSAALVDGDELRDERPRLLDLRREWTPPDADATHEWATMLRLAAGMLVDRAPAAVGVSFGGPVDYAAGLVRLSHHVRGWENMPLRDRLAAGFSAPVTIDNDANVAALGEWRFGAGRGVADLLYITVSTGVGGGWVLGGRPWRGHDGMAGEIGHIVVDPAGPLCLCGKRGCVERLASGPYMAADYAEVTGRREPESGEVITGRDVAEAAAGGDEPARAILRRGAWALGTAIGNAANLANPQRFILGGGVTKSGEAWWAEVRRAARATALPEVRFDVVPAALGDDAPLWGAIALTDLKVDPDRPPQDSHPAGES